MRSRARFFVRGERIGRRLKEAGKQRTLDFGILIAGEESSGQLALIRQSHGFTFVALLVILSARC